MSSDALITYGPTLTELESLKAAEKERRRRIRMMQVRRQARENAARTRELYELKKKRLIESVANEIQEFYDRNALQELQNKREEYQELIDETGTAHQKAEAWEDPAIEAERQACKARQSAEQRCRLAAQALREAESDRKSREEEPRDRLRSVRELEKERAALVAALPKPPNVDSLFEIDLPAAEPTVLVYDVMARNTTHVERAPSGVTINRSDRIENNANEESDLPTDGVTAAKLEADRLQTLAHEQNLRTREGLIKADLRGQRAVKRERVRRHYQTLLSRLDELGRADAARLRNQLGSTNQFTGGDGTTNALANRRLEKAFENELLQQLASTVPLDTNSQSQSEVSHQMSIDMDVDEEPKTIPIFLQSSCAVDSSTSQLNHTANAKGIIGNLHTPDGIAWSISTNLAETDLPPDTVLSPHHTKNSIGLEKMAPAVETQVPPKASISTARNQTAVDSTVTEGTSEAVLGPGERPELPSLRTRHRSIRLRENCTGVSENLSTGNTIQRLDSILDRAEYASPTVLHPLPTESVLDTNVNSMHSSQSHGTSLSEQQKLLDQELAEIDRRIARLRMGSTADRDLNTSRSQTTASTRHGETPLGSSKIAQLTPRDSVVVEGRAVCERADKSPRGVTSSQASQSSTSLVHSIRPQDKPLSARMTPNSVKSGSIGSESRRSLTPLPPKWMQKLTSIISSQIEELKSARQSGPPSTKSASSSVCESSISWPRSCSPKTLVEPSEGGDVPSRSEGSGDASPQSQPTVPEESVANHLLDSKETIKLPNQIADTIVPHPTPMFRTNAPFGVNTVNTESKQLSAPDTRISVEDYDRTPHLKSLSTTPRLSLARLTQAECSVFQSISQLAHRLAQTAIQEATTELAETEVARSNQSESQCAEPRANTVEPKAPSDRDIFSSSEVRSTSTTTTIKMNGSSDGIGSSTARSLKAELRALLTSSLISSLLSGSGTTTGLLSSSLTGARTATSETLQQLLGSTCVEPDPDCEDLVEHANRPAGDLLELSECGRSTKSSLTNRTVISESFASPSDIDLIHLDGEATVAAASKNPDLISTSLPAPQCDRYSSGTDHPPQESQPSESSLVKVNKNWLLSLVGREKPENSGARSPFSISPRGFSESSTTNTRSFHALSPADLSCEFTDSHEVSPCNQSTSLAPERQCDLAGSPTHSGWSAASTTSPLSSASCTTVGAHLIAFKPLPRLDEAPSEESIPDLSATLVHPLPLTLTEGESLQTPSTSWTDSRKSNEFCALSRCSTSNSNLGANSDLVHDTASSTLENREDTAEDDQTTIHRLRTDVPATPVEPCETSVVPCLGSNSSASVPLLDSPSTSVSSSPVPSQFVGPEGASWVPRASFIPSPAACLIHPSTLAHVTRTTTTIDSSMVWDNDESAPHVEQAASVGRRGFLVSTESSALYQSSQLEVDSPHQGIPVTPSSKSHAQTPRPTSPADGAAVSTGSCVPNTSLPDGKLTQFASMPVIYVDCSAESPFVECGGRSTPHRTIRGALYASWDNFATVPLPPVDPPTSLSDSLRSFQRHEASCLLMEDGKETRENPLPKHSRSPSPQRCFLKQSPGRVTSTDVRQNAVAIHSVTRTSEPFKQPNSYRRASKTRSHRRAWDCHVPNQTVDSNRGGAAVMLPSRGLNRAHLRSTAIRGNSPDPLELAMSNVTVEEIRHVNDSSAQKKKVTNATRGVKFRESSARARSRPAPRRTDRTNTTSSRPAMPSTKRPAISNPTVRDNRTSHSNPEPAPPSNRMLGPTVSSILQSTSVSLEQTLREQLQRWRAVRLGVAPTAPVLSTGNQPSVQPNASSISIGNTTADLSRQATAASLAGAACSLSLMERVDYASVQPGPPPLVVERNVDEDMSATTLWMNDIAFQPPAALSARPSSPTPNAASRHRTSSDTALAEDEENLETEGEFNGFTQMPQLYLGRHSYRQTNFGSMAFIVDFDPAAVRNTACAGDELIPEARFPMNEIHFTTASRNRYPPESTNATVELRPSNVRSPVQSEVQNNEVGRHGTRNAPTNQATNLETVEPQILSRSKASTAGAVSGPTKRHAVVTPEQKRRYEQARTNRLRVKEFDRVRRERLIRKKKKTVT